MVTKAQYKNYSAQIAELFCSDQTNKVLCKASITERLNTFLDDSIYPVFLSKLSEGGRVYITNLEQFQNKGFRIVLVDLITGERQTAWWTIPYNLPYYGQLPGKLQSHKYYIISNNKTFNSTNRSEIRITHNPEKLGYNLTFVPVEPPGGIPGGTPGGTPGGKIINSPAPNIPTAPGTAPGTDLFAGFDLTTILLIGGVGLAAWYLLKK